jgi:predicted metal-dependent hydrolase
LLASFGSWTARTTSSSEQQELERGLELIDDGAYFEAHEVLEDLWRPAPVEERDFYQGLVHVAVAWHHAGRGNRPGFERQLAKAARRLRPYAPTHRGVDIADLLTQIESASFATLAPVRVNRSV